MAIPEQVANDTGLLNLIFKWLSGALAVLIGIVWKKNENRFKAIEADMKLKASKSCVDQVDALREDSKKELSKHIIEALKQNEKFITYNYFHDYIEKELKPMMTGVANRVDASQKEIKGKLDALLAQTADVIKRPEYKSDITVLHQKIDTKADK